MCTLYTTRARARAQNTTCDFERLSKENKHSTKTRGVRMELTLYGYFPKNALFILFFLCAQTGG